MKRIIIIAGPNGAGKTTFAKEFLRDLGISIFVNADLIAASLSPSDPNGAAIRAGRIMLEELDRHIMVGRSFAFETTLSGLTYLRRIEAWRAAGYVVELVFLSLNTAEEAVERVASRVQQGGHSIPPDVIRRRFEAGLRNFLELYRHRVDDWQWYDNSGPSPRLLQEGANR